MVTDTKMRIPVRLATLVLLTSLSASCDQSDPIELTGVVTFQLLPAKVIRVNQILEDPEPGTSYIGDSGILLEVKDNPEVIANWSVVTVQYLEYTEPRTIQYEILGEPHEIIVKHHAVGVEITGDLSDYIPE